MKNTIKIIICALTIAVLIASVSLSAFASSPESAVIDSFMQVKQAELKVKIEGSSIPKEAFSDQVSVCIILNCPTPYKILLLS